MGKKGKGKGEGGFFWMGYVGGILGVDWMEEFWSFFHLVYNI